MLIGFVSSESESGLMQVHAEGHMDGAVTVSLYSDTLLLSEYKGSSATSLLEIITTGNKKIAGMNLPILSHWEAAWNQAVPLLCEFLVDILSNK